MAIEIEQHRCWISNPNSLRIKKYLSNTRSYLKEGGWIQEQFAAFFPPLKATKEGRLYYDFQALDPAVSCDQVGSLEKTKLPVELIDQFQLAVDQYQARTSQKGRSFNEEISSREFTLPNPTAHPELYWLVADGDELRLVVLWGLESTLSHANIRVEQLPETLRDNFEGRILLEKISTEALSQKQDSSADGESGDEPQAKASTKASKPKRQKKRNPLWFFLVSPVLLLLIVSVLSIFYLGRPVEFKAERLDGLRNQGYAQALKPGESLRFWDGSEYSTEHFERIWVLDRFLKPGAYEITKILNSGSSNTPELETVVYPHVRHNMRRGPIATLLPIPSGVSDGFNVAVTAKNSFHEDYAETPDLRYFVSWGEANGTFEPIVDDEGVVSHHYSSAGVYEITLIAMDASGNWDKDTLEVQISPDKDPVFRIQPVVDVQVVSVSTQQGTQYVKIDLSDSYDIDGQIERFSVDWGDKSEIETPGDNEWILSHPYDGQQNRYTIAVVAEDNDGNLSSKPALLFVDFQSRHMNRAEGENEGLNQILKEATLVRNQPDGIGYELLDFGRSQKHKKVVTVALRNPVSLRGVLLSDVKWTLVTPTGEALVVSDTPRVSLQAVPGNYKLRLIAETPSGSMLECSDSLDLQLSKEPNIVFNVLSWWAQYVPQRERLYELWDR